MEGFSISDGDECWYMELLGKGDDPPSDCHLIAI